MPKVLVVISTGFEEIEAITIIDVLRRAQIEVVIATINDILTVGANAIVIQANQYLKNLNPLDFDMIVLPGGGTNTQNLASSTLVQNSLKLMKEKNRYIAAICAAPYALHTANVLNKNYTCYPSFEEKIRQDGYQGDNQEVVIDEKVITSRGPATAMTFALELIKLLKDENTYQKVKDGLLVK
ncbi:DJ-1 family glyoxalase III [Arcobacter sp. LA11]|uniref:DJ-1 family glyoxalase III n=1 Tax=Arcobacter sp. LA11 TaxID=1898176 RepID=UPI0009330D88|nr:DJ-1 family glyoxalase III [Arcobacter sp. LA11]